MKTTVVHPQDRALQEALRLAAIFAAIKLVLHIAANLWEAHIGWGYFRDEMYYIACGRRLAWGYVDHGPLVAVQARLALGLFGKSLAGIRMLSAVAGAGRIFLTGLLAWSLGGRRPAQGLAMIGVLIAPQYLALDSFLSMNSVESLFWMTCLLALILIVRGGSERLWLLFGVSAGLGLLNKPSMTFFLVALLVALIVTPQRKLLASKWAAAGVALVLLIVLPNLLWQVQNHWPTLEFLRNGQRGNKNVSLGPLAFLWAQINNLQPLSMLIWGAGLVWLLRSGGARGWRWLALTYLFFLAITMALHAKDYYVVPIYPVLFAAGGVAWERYAVRNRAVQLNRAYAFPILETILLVAAVVIAPRVLPVLSPQAWLRYMQVTHLYNPNEETERLATGVFPQFFADRFGWQEEVNEVTRIYNALPPEQKKITGILCDNYGEASAINFLGRGLPFAVSRHNNYYLWGRNGYSFASMIMIEGSTPAHLANYFEHVQVAGHIGTPYTMPYEHKNIYVATGPKLDVANEWRINKNYF